MTRINKMIEVPFTSDQEDQIRLLALDLVSELLQSPIIQWKEIIFDHLMLIYKTIESYQSGVN